MVSTYLRHLFYYPTSDDVDQKYQAQVLYFIWIALFISTLAYGLFLLLFAGSSEYWQFLPLIINLVLLALVKLILNRGHVRFASMLLIGGGWIVLISASFNRGGVFSSAYTSLTLIIILAGFLISGRAGIFFAAMSAFSGFLMIFIFKADSTIASSNQDITFWANHSAVFGILATLQAIITHNIRTALQEARLYTHQLSELNQTLYQEIKARNQTREELDTFFKLSPAYICISQAGYYHRVNPAYQQMLGFPLEDIYSQSTLAFIHPDDQSNSKQVRQQLIEGKPVLNFENRYIAADGGIHWVSWSSIPVGEQAYSVGRDITELKMIQDARTKLEAEKQALAAKQSFVAMIAHEFRTPLSIIVSAGENLRNYYDRLPAERRDTHFASITQQTQYMSQLIEQILLVGEMESGVLQLKPETIRLVEFCEELVAQIKSLLKPGQQLKSILNFDSAALIRADRNLLYHMLNNLLSNAIKYSPSDGTIQFTLEQQADTIVFEISDNGIGIPQADQQRLFEPFYRASNAGLNGAKGTGLGLTIVKDSAEKHGGTIRYHSEVGKGTTFTISLPASLLIPGG